MKNRTKKMSGMDWLKAGTVIGTSVFLTATPAQEPMDNLAALKEQAQRFKAFAEKLSEPQRKALSGAALNTLTMAENWDKLEPMFKEAHRKRSPMALEALKAKAPHPRQVSDPNIDALHSMLAGFTQNETSTAWCGDNVVVAFNDSGSIFEQWAVSPNAGVSMVGYAISDDQGKTFADRGFLPSKPAPKGADFYSLFGDPVVQCAGSKTFYIASLGEGLIDEGGGSFSFRSEISVSKSTNGGVSFGGPVSAAVAKELQFLDKPWMAVDPTDPDRIYVTYTNFDFSGDICRRGLRTAIDLVRSQDGGKTWTKPSVMNQVCGNALVQGSQVAVGPKGEVYVAWEGFRFNPNTGTDTRAVHIRRSDNHGRTFASAIRVSNVNRVGNFGLLQAPFCSASEFPSLGVDRSQGPTRGNVYIAWHDGRYLTRPDGPFEKTTYGYADILMSRSTDGGATWSEPIRVNQNSEPLASGKGTDQYQPAIAVDPRGRVGICFYDRKRDKNNFLIDRYCAKSNGGGNTWEKAARKGQFPPTHGIDFFINPFYMGDYDTLASDFTQSQSGFIGAYGDNSLGNPDVRRIRWHE